MATKKTVEQQDPEIVERIVPEDPWKVMVEVNIPRGADKGNDVWVCVNGRSWQIPKGQRVQVPAPVAEVLQNTDAMQQFAQEEKDRLAKG